MTQTKLSDREFLLRFGDMCSDEEIQRMLDRLSPADEAYVRRKSPWLDEGPPWEGQVIQGSLEITYNVTRIS